MPGPAMFIKHKQTGKFLFLLRDDKPGIASPGCWSIPTGTREDGESDLDCAKRELKEETGLEVDLVLIERRVVTTYRNEQPFRNPVAIFYGETDVDEEDLVLGEGQKLKYFTEEEALKLKLSPALRIMLEEGFIKNNLGNSISSS
ncbi:MAG: NUDIX domain-containing protein [Candidatus Nanoarchaeia archaeon]